MNISVRMNRMFIFPSRSGTIQPKHQWRRYDENGTFRKHPRVPQAKTAGREQPAEVPGVTPGAVYKREAKLPVPELPAIIKPADFFDTSVDVPPGCRVRNNRLEALADGRIPVSGTVFPQQAESGGKKP